jgi:hypothetical protein
VDAWGLPVGEGASAARYCTFGGVGKLNSPASPYAVANEFIAGRLGMIIGLPVPPGTTATTDDGELAYVGFRFGKQGEKPPPIIPEHFVADNPHLAAGVVAFDSWIGNEDRHPKNLSYVREPRIPPVVFDHERALLGAEAGKAVERLTDRVGESFVGGCLATEIRDGASFDDWAARIASISAGVIRDVCATALSVGAVTADENEAAIAFLQQRQTRIVEFVSSSPALANVAQWGLHAASR